MSYQTSSVLGVLSRVNFNPNDRERLVLPYIQRDYVWPEDKVVALLDSTVRGYPLGTVLFWETKRETKYREFQKSFPSSTSFLNKDEGVPCTIVLDGQQRIQSLYMSCHGSLNGKEVYFNLLSGYSINKGVEGQEISYSDEIYEFEFLSEQVSSELNSKGNIFIKLKQLLFAQPSDIENYKIELADRHKLSIDDRALINTNITTLREAFNRQDYFSFYTIDKQLMTETSAKAISEVLEIFFRVNSTGTPLSKSELIFSLIKSKWDEAFETFERIKFKLDEKDAFLFENDFIIKCLLTIHTLQSRFSIEKLEDKIIKRFMEESSITRFDKSMEVLKVFLKEKCLLRCDAVFNKSYNTFLPVIYYIYNHPNNVIPESEERKVRYFIYASLMKKYISRYTDNRIPKLLKERFQGIKDTPDYFPLKESLDFLEPLEGKLDLDDDVTLNANISLIMNIVYKGLVLPPYQRTTHKDLDHIYPKSKLEGFGEELINSYGNFRYISNIINKIKTDEDPLVYFENQLADILLKEHLVDKKLLSKEEYGSFVADRQQRIKAEVKEFLKY